MSKMNAGIIRKVGWVHLADRKLLCARSEGRRSFYLPGGKPEAGESMEEALRREVMEEIGVALACDLLPMGDMVAPADGQAGRDVHISLFGATPLGPLSACGEIAELRWLALADAAIASTATAQLLQRLQADDMID